MHVEQISKAFDLMIIGRYARDSYFSALLHNEDKKKINDSFQHRKQPTIITGAVINPKYYLMRKFELFVCVLEVVDLK